MWGTDLHGKPFVQHARTVNATSVGARLIGIDCVREGEVISLQHGAQQSRCRVVWVGHDVARARQIGIRSIESEKTLFGPSLRSAAAKSAAAASASAGKSGAAHRPHTARSVMPEAPGTRRSQQRFHCSGGIELRRNEGAPPVFGNLSDISLTGCYVQTVSSFPVGTELLYMIRVRDTVLRGRAQVKTSHHAVGIGLVFLHMGPEDQEKLEFVIGTLVGSQQLRPEDQRMIVPEDPLPPSQGFSGSSVRPAAQGGTGKMSVQITRTISELNQVEQALVVDRVDPRIIAQFHDAVEHLRQTAWSAVQWAELNSTGGDPFEVLPQLEAERMHMLRKLAHNVTADLDSGSVSRLTEGISELYEVAHALYRGLRKIVIDGAEE